MVDQYWLQLLVLYDIIRENIVRDIGQILCEVINLSEKNYTCCFFGHRKVKLTEDLMVRLKDVIEFLITTKKVDTFLFGSKSEFDKLCLEVVTEAKKKYPHIRRIYVRAEFPYIDESYTSYLLELYEHTYYPERLLNSGRAIYVERNCEMIDKSGYCVIYYDESYMPPKRKKSRRDQCYYQPNSGTKCAYEYAVKNKLQIVNVI